jgi:hypothetical protein
MSPGSRVIELYTERLGTIDYVELDGLLAVVMDDTEGTEFFHPDEMELVLL